jgi:general transcription factor 3C polypeptide 5 (transcription factor C subunit 1)
MCVPITSHNAMTDNVLVKVTVPKRTGRKRRRGTQDPFQSDNSAGDSHELERYESEGRRITPSRLLRTLKENPWRYTISAVGKIQHTQRFRGISNAS